MHFSIFIVLDIICGLDTSHVAIKHAICCSNKLVIDCWKKKGQENEHYVSNIKLVLHTMNQLGVWKQDH